MNTIELKNTAINPVVTPTWRREPLYRCHIALIPEADGRVSAVVLNLPGAGSCGNTEEEAMRNVREAVTGVIESHKEAKEDIPWIGLDKYEIPEGAKQKWILVNA